MKEDIKGGSYRVTDSGIEHSGGTLNPGDPGYADAIAKAKVEDEKHDGALNRTPAHADLEEKPAPAKKTPAASATPSPSSSSTPINTKKGEN